MVTSDHDLPLINIITSNDHWFKTLDKKLQALTIYAFLSEKKHLDFVDRFLQSNFLEVAACIGREFIRLIQEAAECSPLILNTWRKMINSPRELDPVFTGIDSLLEMPTQVDYFQSRLSYEMEEKLLYILRHCGPSSRDHLAHMAWYVKLYLENNRYFLNF
jgi:integrator complex subunit 3